MAKTKFKKLHSYKEGNNEGERFVNPTLSTFVKYSIGEEFKEAYLDPTNLSVEQTLSIKDEIRDQFEKIKYEIETEGITDEDLKMKLVYKYIGDYSYSKHVFKNYDYKHIKQFIENPELFNLEDMMLQICVYYINTYNIHRSMRAVCISDDYKRKFTNNPCVCITINYLQKRRDHITNITEQKLLAKLFEIDTLLVNARFDTEDGRLNYKSVDLELKVYDRLVEQMNNIKGGSVLAKENINIFISKREDENKTIDTEHIDIAEDDDGY